MKKFFQIFRLVKLPFYVSVFFLGYFYAYRVLKREFNFKKVILGFLIVALLWFYSVILNDWFDYEIDKFQNKKTTATLTERHPILLTVCFGIVFLVLILSLKYFGQIFTLICLGEVILSLLYSAYPFRLKNFYPFSIMILSSLVVLDIMGGISIYVLNSKEFLNIIPYRFLIASFLSISLTFHLKDYPDYEAEKHFGIKSFFVLFGQKKGMKISGIMVWGAFIIFALLSGFYNMIPIGFILGFIGFKICNSEKFSEIKFWLLYFVYFIFIVINLLRIEI